MFFEVNHAIILYVINANFEIEKARLVRILNFADCLISLHHTPHVLSVWVCEFACRYRVEGNGHTIVNQININEAYLFHVSVREVPCYLLQALVPSIVAVL